MDSATARVRRGRLWGGIRGVGVGRNKVVNWGEGCSGCIGANGSELGLANEWLWADGVCFAWVIWCVYRLDRDVERVRCTPYKPCSLQHHTKGPFPLDRQHTFLETRLGSGGSGPLTVCRISWLVVCNSLGKLLVKNNQVHDRKYGRICKQLLKLHQPSLSLYSLLRKHTTTTNDLAAAYPTRINHNILVHIRSQFTQIHLVLSQNACERVKMPFVTPPHHSNPPHVPPPAAPVDLQGLSSHQNRCH